eukprot:CAMPEP_0181304944 /NCGR_PEP_ID=MMETSP1101-20121128/9445_1 /TAXON_ID=46948 /ORGANISM="Rhodomonas abbreviata, Strain Caron Lab Isolate" /LENGTH=339 /DNA_ID=CAMNT_0023410785 /DNA_START=36 /DNA_END=1055 /DNA_ORIENTATION=+
MAEPGIYGSVETRRSTAKAMATRSRLLLGSVALAGAVLLVGGAVDVFWRENASQATELYDIPNFVYQRTQVHFPQAEENWLNMAAKGEIGDDVKPEHVLHNLNSVISDARSHALQENYEARVKAKVDAMTENYSTYDVHKGKVVNNFYGGKQTGGSVTLKPQSTNTASLPQLAQPQIEGGVMMKQQERKTALQMRQQELKNNHMAVVPEPHPATMSFAVDVPAGLHAGQEFIAKVPNHGNMLVQVPAGAMGGSTVSIQVPAGAEVPAARKPAAHPQPHPVKRVVHRPVLRQPRAQIHRPANAAAHPGAVSEHPFAAKMLMDSLFDHYHSTPDNVFGLEH